MTSLAEPGDLQAVLFVLSAWQVPQIPYMLDVWTDCVVGTGAVDQDDLYALCVCDTLEVGAIVSLGLIHRLIHKAFCVRERKSNT